MIEPHKQYLAIRLSAVTIMWAGVGDDPQELAKKIKEEFLNKNIPLEELKYIKIIPLQMWCLEDLL
jgi:hypothetical protein